MGGEIQMFQRTIYCLLILSCFTGPLVAQSEPEPERETALRLQVTLDVTRKRLEAVVNELLATRSELKTALADGDRRRWVALPHG